MTQTYSQSCLSNPVKFSIKSSPLALLSAHKMSVSRSAVKWPANGVSQIRCLHQSSLARTQLCSSVRAASVRRQEKDALAILQFLQKRRQSSSTGRKPTEQKPPLPPSKLILRALRQGVSFRPLFNAFRGQNLRNLFRQSPEELIIAIFLYDILSPPSLAYTCAVCPVPYAVCHWVVLVLTLWAILKSLWLRCCHSILCLCVL